ncbi:bacillithiol system redox-active protein YtxJ [Lysinibacillus sp. ZYM-1]|uniref:bacillithiol system redox-active protein YtxJ n=1 Tax=Lysinibacillus sp. ZYM-1 TaxID=1681184 RepID=UPI0006CE690D|nr:bacillithiol system redox-active protein YtxJ [Lysinibacillus sp. ZYM-1]KPN95650.1 general stress protein [Lysinibacillus sp. ZYM-1]
MQRIRTLDGWRDILEQSCEKPCLVLKISMTCLSSISALKEVKLFVTELPKYLVIVQKEREVSDAIARDLRVKHESPQLLILRDGKGIWQATHYKIKQPLLAEGLKQYVR